VSSAGGGGGATGYTNGSAGGGGSPLVTADTPRVVRQLSLSMSMISDDVSDDDEDASADEW